MASPKTNTQMIEQLQRTIDGQTSTINAQKLLLDQVIQVLANVAQTQDDMKKKIDTLEQRTRSSTKENTNKTDSLGKVVIPTTWKQIDWMDERQIDRVLEALGGEEDMIAYGDLSEKMKAVWSLIKPE
ncbi:hypothetical protein FKW77_006596 [Venturia effusa]|uniref:Uncharacterized protein n=1 Tax=Venturia effusa TaxID=50376 RepID=A0A517LN17_9PEZI|nr:hypothetical protein FKW77_006596 [Venturia effusa]